MKSRYKRNSFPLWQHSVYHCHHTPQLDPILSKFDSLHATTIYFLSIHLVIAFSCKQTLSLGISSLRVICFWALQYSFPNKSYYTKSGELWDSKLFNFWVNLQQIYVKIENPLKNSIILVTIQRGRERSSFPCVLTVLSQDNVRLLLPSQRLEDLQWRDGVHLTSALYGGER